MARTAGETIRKKHLFQVHLWAGAAAGAYMLLMSVSGSAIVFRNELTGHPFVEWLVRFHTNLLMGAAGRFVNGVVAACLTLLCLTGAVIWCRAPNTGAVA
jgi:uncharacterized iron-regulated membrane protein